MMNVNKQKIAGTSLMTLLFCSSSFGADKVVSTVSQGGKAGSSVHSPKTKRSSSRSDRILTSRSAEVEVPPTESLSSATSDQNGSVLAPDSANTTPVSNPMDSSNLPQAAEVSSSMNGSALENPQGDPQASPNSNLDQFFASQKTKKFVGTPINLQMRDAPIVDVLRLIGEASGFNIVIADDVSGKITLSLSEVPWDQALDLVLHTMRLGAEKNNNVLRVLTLKGLRLEKDEELTAMLASQATEPYLTRVFPINFALLPDLQKIIAQSLGISTAGSPGTVSNHSLLSQSPNKVAFVQADARTNSLIVRDTSENLERVKRLIELLDTQTPQVMIEAKIIEATESFSKNLSGNLGIGSGSKSLGSFSGGNPLDPLVGSPGIFSDGSKISSAGSSTLGVSLDFIPGVSRLNALISLGESESQLKVISSPKTVVLNKQSANIVSGTPVLVPGTTSVAGVGSAVPTTTVQQANISLSVLPTVTNDSSVLMELNVEKDVAVALSDGNSGIGNRNMKTMVLVDSGSTLVIGGIYTLETNRTASGFPFLRKIPIIGSLFGSENNVENKSELFIFITPRILNSKDAGLSS